MRIIVYLGHPAHFHLFRWVIRDLRALGHEVRILSSSKDVLDELLRNDGLEYTGLSDGSKGRGRIGILAMLFRRGRKMRQEIRAWKPDLMAGTSAEGPLVARLCGLPFVNLNEDDHDVVPLYSRLSYPFSSHILMPQDCRAGRWEHKTIRYPGFHELAYLHPARFTPDPALAAKLTGGRKPYILMRFSALTAHHDQGIRGITKELALQIIQAARGIRVFITSERPLPAQLEQYRLAIDPLDMHHVMASARVYVGDSQTMAAECAMLGVPFIRYNDFVGRITYLAQLEEHWKLGFGFRPGQEEELLGCLQNILVDQPAVDWKGRRDSLLQRKMDTASFLSWFLSSYPESATEAVRPDFNWQQFMRLPL